MYKDNNPLAYIRQSKIGAAQIRWLNKIALFHFDMKYRTCKLNKAVDALHHHPYVPEKMDNDLEWEEYETFFMLWCVMS